jgi:beta-phosphoglucomutase
MHDPLAVIFDMDGVLVDTYHAHYQSWLMMAERENLHFTEAEFAPTFGRTSREIIAHFWGDGRYDDAEIAALDAQKEAAFRQLIAQNFPAMPGAKELLAALHENGFRLAVGSSGPPENVAMVVEKLAAQNLFGAVVTGMDVTRGKPDPQVFLLAAQRLGVPPARCVVVEDARPGIEAAHAAGMKAVGLVSTGRTRAELAAADLLAATLEELSPEVFRGLIVRN